MNCTNNQNQINVGIDTGKHNLDIYIHPLDIFFTVTNDDKGIKQAIKEIKKYKPTRIVIEATGRLEHPFVLACSKAKLPFCVANPQRIRNFAKSNGQLAKTDALDARIIAQFGEAIKPPLSQVKPDMLQRMSDLVARRRQLMAMQTMEKNHMKSMPKHLASSIKPVLTALKNQLDKVDAKIAKLIESSDDYQAKSDIIQSVPGVGKVVAYNLLSNMPELGHITNKQAAALVGVAPINRESGSYYGKRHIQGGRYQIRTVMYMAMMSAIQCNPIFKSTYEKLLAKGKPKKVALVACVRKMIVILNSMVRDGVLWDQNMAK